MCGIAGTISDTPDQVGLVNKMVGELEHRGPDGKNFYQSGDYFIGMTRLAINDLSGGDQPLYDSSKRFVVMYNGEIYNSPNLRKKLKDKGKTT